MRSSGSRIDDVRGRSHGSRQDLGLEPVILIDGDDAADQAHTVLTDVIEAPDEGTDNISAGLGGQQSLPRRKTERDVHTDSLFTQRLARFDAVPREGTFDHNVLM